MISRFQAEAKAFDRNGPTMSIRTCRKLYRRSGDLFGRRYLALFPFAFVECCREKKN